MRFSFVLISIFFCMSLYSQPPQTFTGEYRSIAGVMDPLSCYCYNGGYLVYGKDEAVKVCFDKFDKKIENGRITVRGRFEKITHKSNPDNPCPGDSEMIFIVDSYDRMENNHPEHHGREHEWNGDWITSRGDKRIKTSIHVEGDKARGSYEYEDGKIDGKLMSGKGKSAIEGTWRQRGKEGWFHFEMETNGQKFSGVWGYANNKKPSGTWNGEKTPR